MYKWFVKPLLFCFDPEKVHHFTFFLIGFLHKIPGISALIKRTYKSNNPKLTRNVFGLTFPNPVGLAAGFDKDAKRFRELSNFGFGFIEIGTLTPKPQDGNPKKRLFRLKKDHAIINRMGFNNEGVLAAVQRLKSKKNIIVGGNIGKNKMTPNESAVDDYLYCFDHLFEWVDYFVVNVSSPNTPNLRDLQEKEPLTALLKTLQNRNDSKPKRKPILLKIAPDLTESQLSDIIEIVSITQIDGVIATNTTLSREGLQTDCYLANEPGGLSGKPLTDRSTAVIRFLYTQSKGAFPIIGVGGIHSASDATEKLEAGASLVQLYTGFVYEGPQLIKQINKAIASSYC